MSPTLAPRPGAGAYLRPLALIAFGLVAWGLTTGMTMQAHRIASLTAAGENLGSGAALFIDAMVVLLPGCAGLLLNKGYRVSAGIAALCLIIFTGYSMASVAGFGAAERIAKYQTTTHNLDSGAAAVEERNAAVRRDRDRVISFLEAQIKNERREGYRAELLTSLQKLVAQPLPQEVWRADTVMADPEAEMFADLAGRFGLDVRGFQVGKAVLLGVLLVLGKVICFSFATLLWPLRVAAPTTNFVTNIPPAPATSIPPAATSIAPPTLVTAASLPTNFVTSIPPAPSADKVHSLPLAVAAAPVAEPANSNVPSAPELTPQRAADLTLGRDFLRKRSSIYAWMLEAMFPRPVRIGKRRVTWRRWEFIDWIRTRPPA